MLTASGDQTISLWDTGHADQVASFRGHSGSVKTVCPMPAAHAVFASGACQGSHLCSSSCAVLPRPSLPAPALAIAAAPTKHASALPLVGP